MPGIVRAASRLCSVCCVQCAVCIVSHMHNLCHAQALQFVVRASCRVVCFAVCSVFLCSVSCVYKLCTVPHQCAMCVKLVRSAVLSVLGAFSPRKVQIFAPLPCKSPPARLCSVHVVHSVCTTNQRGVPSGLQGSAVQQVCINKLAGDVAIINYLIILDVSLKYIDESNFREVRV